MHIDYETLRFKALCVLDQAIDDCHSAPLQGSLGLRFALAYLYAISDGRREPFDAFWREVHDAKASAYSKEDQHHLRTSYARTQLCCISRGVGIELTAELMQRLRDASGQNLTLGTHGYNGSLRPTSSRSRAMKRTPETGLSSNTRTR